MKSKRDGRMRGMIKCPCCQKVKVAVYDDSRGHASIQCSKCKTYSIYDFDTMTANLNGVIMGCSQIYND